MKSIQYIPATLFLFASACQAGPLASNMFEQRAIKRMRSCSEDASCMVSPSHLNPTALDACARGTISVLSVERTPDGKAATVDGICEQSGQSVLFRVFVSGTRGAMFEDYYACLNACPPPEDVFTPYA